MKILIKTWETRLVTLRSPDLGNWTGPCQAWENFSYAWSVWEEAETQTRSWQHQQINHEPLFNASNFNKAVLKLVENRKLLPHFLSRRARHDPNKKTILCPLGMVLCLMMSLLIGWSYQSWPLIGPGWPLGNCDNLIILKEKNDIFVQPWLSSACWPARLGGEV